MNKAKDLNFNDSNQKRLSDTTSFIYSPVKLLMIIGKYIKQSYYK